MTERKLEHYMIVKEYTSDGMELLMNNYYMLGYVVEGPLSVIVSATNTIQYTQVMRKS